MVRPPSIFRLRDVALSGLTRPRLRALVRTGEAERIGRGLYRWPCAPTELDTVAAVAARVPGAIVCLLTALLMHGIGSQLPSDVWIAIDRKARRPKIGKLPVRIVRFSGRTLTAGIERRTIQGVRIAVTSPARTVVDCFRYRNKIGLDVALEALKDALQRQRVSVGDVIRLAKICRISSVIRPYIEGALA